MMRMARICVAVVSRWGSEDFDVLKRALYDGVAGGDDVREVVVWCAAVLRECCSAAVQSNEMGNALVRCLGRQSPRASQCKSQPG